VTTTRWPAQWGPGSARRATRPYCLSHPRPRSLLPSRACPAPGFRLHGPTPGPDGLPGLCPWQPGQPPRAGVRSASGTLKATCSRRTTSVSSPHSSRRAQPRSGGGSDRASCPRRRSSSASVAASRPKALPPPLDRGRRRHRGGRGPHRAQARVHEEHRLHGPSQGAAPPVVRLIRSRRVPLPCGAQLVRSARPGMCADPGLPVVHTPSLTLTG